MFNHFFPNITLNTKRVFNNFQKIYGLLNTSQNKLFQNICPFELILLGLLIFFRFYINTLDLRVNIKIFKIVLTKQKNTLF